MQFFQDTASADNHITAHFCNKIGPKAKSRLCVEVGLLLWGKLTFYSSIRQAAAWGDVAKNYTAAARV